MNSPPNKCRDGQGRLCPNDAEVWLLAPGESEPMSGMGGMCRKHGQEVIDEYRTKLGEHWAIVPIP